MQPTKQQLRSGRYKLIDGIWHKLCSGQAHEEPEWLPATPKYYYIKGSGPTKGRPVARCRLCQAWDKLKNPGSHHGFIDVRLARPFYVEAINRIGMTELSRRSGLSLHHLQSIYLRPNKKYVRKLSLRKVMLELTSMRRHSEHNSDPRVRWQTERRNNIGLDVCPGCGTPKSNATAGCKQCWDRWYNYRRHRKITKKEWNKIKILLSR